MAAEIGNNYAEGQGRPTKYDPAMDKLVYNYCIMGATDKQLANFLDICEATLDNWKKEYPSFLGSIRAGKEEADVKVAHSMYNACLGVTVRKDKEIKVRKIDPETKKVVEGVEVISLREELPGDVNAMKFWLSNRQKENWKNKQDVDHTSGGEPIQQITGMTIKE